MINPQQWQSALQQLNCIANQQQLQQLQDYLELLQRWNKVYNLTAVRNPADMLPLHIFDSLSVAHFIKGNNCLDVGSGAGLPGIPLAIMQPERQFIMLDTNGKKTRFIQQAIIQLKLDNAHVIQTRVENWQSPQKFDAVISRAFASIADFITTSSKHLSPIGILYAMKGKYQQTEINKIPKDFVLKNVYKLQVPTLNAERHLLEITR